MRKIPTLFKKEPQNLAIVTADLDPNNTWVYDMGVKATRKYDGSACAIIDGKLYKRYDVKKGRTAPVGAIPCQEPDVITGHHPHWIACEENKAEDKYFFEGYNNLTNKTNGTYELCGPKVQGNPEKLDAHQLIPHGQYILQLNSLDYDYLKIYLSLHDMEGIVWHHPDGRMCKLRKSDFGFKKLTCKNKFLKELEGLKNISNIETEITDIFNMLFVNHITHREAYDKVLKVIKSIDITKPENL